MASRSVELGYRINEKRNPSITPTTNLKRLRLQRGESQRQLAEKVGCSDNAILCWEQARNVPQPIWARQLEGVLKLPVAALLSTNRALLPNAETTANDGR